MKNDLNLMRERVKAYLNNVFGYIGQYLGALYIRRFLVEKQGYDSSKTFVYFNTHGMPDYAMLMLFSFSGFTTTYAIDMLYSVMRLQNVRHAYTWILLDENGRLDVTKGIIVRAYAKNVNVKVLTFNDFLQDVGDYEKDVLVPIEECLKRAFEVKPHCPIDVIVVYCPNFNGVKGFHGLSCMGCIYGVSQGLNCPFKNALEFVFCEVKTLYASGKCPKFASLEDFARLVKERGINCKAYGVCVRLYSDFRIDVSILQV